jgi:hypothetical protein
MRSAMEDVATSKPSHRPLLFIYKDLVEGRGFVAEVVAHGRALAAREGAEHFSLYGVNPGGLAAEGPSEEDAHAEFRRVYTLVLHDIAYSARNYDEFRADVQRFFHETNVPTEKEWLSAVEEVRKGHVNVDLPVQPADSPRFVEVTLQETRATQSRPVNAERVIAA